MFLQILSLSNLAPRQRQALLTRTEADLTSTIEKIRPIVDAVREEGDAAVIRFAKAFDGAEIAGDAIAATSADFAKAEREVSHDLRQALAFAASNIRAFHQRQMPEAQWQMEMSPGHFAGERTTPIASLACYIPRGKGSFPSTVLMTCIPARVAGVEDICIVTPPGPDGAVDAATLVAAKASGVDKVFKAGGAQAIAAVAYGTRTIPRCAKVVGPGSPWVVAAKRLLADLIDTGTPAGPSESIIFADHTTDGRLAALDLLIEAEHGADSSAFLVTNSRTVAEAAVAALPDYLKAMSPERAEYARAVLSSKRGGILLACDAAEAMAFINDYAPEHLQILSKEPRQYLGMVKHAGEILLGERTPSTLGNFVAGPSHVLPTGGWARTCSALSVHDFLKRSSVVEVRAEAYAVLAAQAKIIAEYEGFGAHANAVGELRAKLLGD